MNEARTSPVLDRPGPSLSKASVPGVLSVVIPTLNAAASLPGCIQALRAPLVREIIVADGGSSDDTAEAARAVGARVLGPLPPSRGAQIRAGCATAGGDWLLVLHADTLLSPGWADAAARHIAEHPDKAGWFRFALDDPRRIARMWEAGVALRSRLGLPYGDQGLLLSRRLHDAVGGYRDLPLMEDVDLVRRLSRSRLRALRARALTSAVRYQRDGYARRSARNVRLLGRWLAGADPADLARDYGR